MPQDIRTYSLLTDFPNQLMGEDRFLKEISDSNISQVVILLNSGVSSPDNVDITFADTLLAAEITILDALVAAHDGSPLPEGVVIPPSESDDVTVGVSIGDTRVDVVTGLAYICTDNTAGAAKWELISPNQEFKGQSDSVSSTTSLIFQNKVTIGPDIYTGGQYELTVSYGWNATKRKDFEAQIQLDGVAIYELHKEGSQPDKNNFVNTGSGQRHYITRMREVTIAAGVHTATLDYRTSEKGKEASIWEAFLRLRKVG